MNIWNSIKFNNILYLNLTRYFSSPVHKPVEVYCGSRSMCIRIEKDFQNSFWPNTRYENLRLSEPCESFDLIAEDESVTLCLSHDDDYDNYEHDCGTNTQQNDTHIVFSNNITNSGTDSLNEVFIRLD